MERIKYSLIIALLSAATMQQSKAQVSEDYLINNDLNSSGSITIQSVRFDSDGERVLYDVIENGDFTKLNSASTLGPNTETQVAPNLPTSFGFATILIADENLERAGILLTDLTNLDRRVLFSVPLDGSNAVEINDRVGGLGNRIALNNSASDFFFNARISDTSNVLGLLRRDINANSESVRIDTQEGSDTDFVDFDFSLTQDDSHAIYSSRGTDLYAANLGNGEIVRLDTDGINVVLGAQGVSRFRVSNTTSRVAYLAPVGAQGGSFPRDFELFSTRLDGTGRTRLSGSGTIVQNFLLSSNEQQVVYLADEDTTGVFELYFVDVEGGESIKLNAPLGQNEEINVRVGFRISERANFVVYNVRNTLSDDVQTFISLLTNPVQRVQLPAPLFSLVDNGFGGFPFTRLPSNLSGDTVAFASSTQSPNFSFYIGQLSSGQFSQFPVNIPLNGINQLSFLNDETLLFLGTSPEGNANLYAYSLTERQAIQLNRETLGLGVNRYWNLENSNRVVYQADVNVAFQQELVGFNTDQIQFESSNPLCFPIISQSGGIPVICL